MSSVKLSGVEWFGVFVGSGRKRERNARGGKVEKKGGGKGNGVGGLENKEERTKFRLSVLVHFSHSFFLSGNPRNTFGRISRACLAVSSPIHFPFPANAQIAPKLSLTPPPPIIQPSISPRPHSQIPPHKTPRKKKQCRYYSKIFKFSAKRFFVIEMRLLDLFVCFIFFFVFPLSKKCGNFSKSRTFSFHVFSHFFFF